MSTTTRARPEQKPKAAAGQRWGVAVVAALPALLVALAMPLVIEGSLSGFVYAPLVILVTALTAAFGTWIGLAAVAFGMGIGIAVGPGGYAPTSLLLSAGLAGALLIGTWLGQVLARGRWPVAAAIPGLALVVAVLATGVTGSLEAGVLAAFTTLSISLLLVLLGPWNGVDAVRPARWAEVVAVATIAIAALVTYAVSVSLGGVVTEPRVHSLFSRDDPQSRTDGGVPDPFLVAARWQLDPTEAGRVLFSISTGPDQPQNRPTWSTFSTYNGIAWIEPPTYGVSGEDIPTPDTDRLDRAYETGTRVTVAVGLPGQWVPVPQRIDQVLSPVATRADPQSGIVAAVSSPVDKAFDLRYSLAVAEPDRLRKAEPALSADLDPSVAIPAPLAGPMAELAAQVEEKAGKSTWDRLQVLSQELRDPRFTAAPAQALAAGPPDRSYAGLDRVLAEGVGFQEQYAAIWAVISRSWGVPTRLVIGFPLDDAAAEGITTVEAPEVSVWAEARLEGLGWVAFQSSPQDREAGRPAVVKPLTPAEVPREPTPTPSPSASGGGANGGGEATDDNANPVSSVTRSIPWAIVIPVALVVAGLAWLVYVAIRRRRVRDRLRSGTSAQGMSGFEPGSPRARVLGAWTWARLLLAEAWIPLPLSYAPAADAAYSEDMPDDCAWSVVTLARLAGPAVYGPRVPDESVVVEAWRCSEGVGRAVRKATGWRTVLRRITVPIDPAAVAAPRTGRAPRPAQPPLSGQPGKSTGGSA